MVNGVAASKKLQDKMGIRRPPAPAQPQLRRQRRVVRRRVEPDPHRRRFLRTTSMSLLLSYRTCERR